MTETDA